MIQCLRSRNPVSRIADQQPIQQVARLGPNTLICRFDSPQIWREPFDALTARQCIEIWPGMLVWSSAQLPNLL